MENMKNTINLLGLAAIVFAFAFQAAADPVEIPYEGWSNEFSLDTANTAPGSDLTFYNNSPIRFDAAWAEGAWREIKVEVTPKSTGIPYLVFISDVEEAGSYIWDYASIIDPDNLPWYTDYTFSYTIFSGDTIIETYEAPFNIRIMPEPCFALMALAALAFVCGRK